MLRFLARFSRSDASYALVGGLHHQYVRIYVFSTHNLQVAVFCSQCLASLPLRLRKLKPCFVTLARAGLELLLQPLDGIAPVSRPPLRPRSGRTKLGQPLCWSKMCSVKRFTFSGGGHLLRGAADPK